MSIIEEIKKNKLEDKLTQKFLEPDFEYKIKTMTTAKVIKGKSGDFRLNFKEFGKADFDNSKYDIDFLNSLYKTSKRITVIIVSHDDADFCLIPLEKDSESIADSVLEDYINYKGIKDINQIKDLVEK